MLLWRYLEKYSCRFWKFICYCRFSNIKCTLYVPNRSLIYFKFAQTMSFVFSFGWLNYIYQIPMEYIPSPSIPLESRMNQNFILCFLLDVQCACTQSLCIVHISALKYSCLPQCHIFQTLCVIKSFWNSQPVATILCSTYCYIF